MAEHCLDMIECEFFSPKATRKIRMLLNELAGHKDDTGRIRSIKDRMCMIENTRRNKQKRASRTRSTQRLIDMYPNIIVDLTAYDDYGS